MLRRSILTLLLAAASATALGQAPAPDYGSFQAKYPNSMFAVKNPPYRGTLLVFDLGTQGEIPASPVGTANLTASQLTTYAPPGVYSTLAQGMREYFDFAAGSDSSNAVLSSEERARLVAYSGATAQLDLSLRVEGAEWVLKCRLATATDAKETEFRAPAGQDLALAQQASLWAVQGMGIDFTPAELAPFHKTLFGGIAPSTSDPLIAGMLKGDFESGKQVLAKSPDDLYVRSVVSNLAIRADKEKEALPLLVKAPLELTPTIPARELLLRVKLFSAAGATPLAMNDLMLALATNPGNDDVYATTPGLFAPARLDDDAITQLNPWRLRLHGRGVDQARGAAFLNAAAMHFMPAEGLAAAGAEALDAMIYYAESSLKMAQAGIDKVGPAPALVETAMIDLAILGRREDMDKLFESALKDYASCTRLWERRLTLELPSMHGDPAKTNAILDKVVGLAATAPDVGLIPFDNLVNRARAAAGDKDPIESTKALRTAEPDSWARISKGIDAYMKGADPGFRLARVSFMLGAMGDWDAVDALAKGVSPADRALSISELKRMGHENTANRIAALDKAG